MRSNVDPQKIEQLMKALGREARGSGCIYLKIITKLWGRIFICSSDRRHLIFLYTDNQLDDR
jgi:hypothetical protein